MKSCRILVLDEEEAIRTLLGAILSVTGAEILGAATAREALDLAVKSRPIDLFVTEIMMRDMDGIDLAVKLRKLRCVKRCLFLSGYYPSEAVLPRLQTLGLAKFLAKPFRIPELVRTAQLMLIEPIPEKTEAAIRWKARSVS